MFILNPKSIKRKTICVENDLKVYLTKHGYSPIAKNDLHWIFIYSDEIDKLIHIYNQNK